MTQTSKPSTSPMLIIGFLFFIFGFFTWLNSTLILFLQITCELSTFQSMLVTSAFYISYFITALPSSRILKKTGYKNGMTLGLMTMAMGVLLFIPAANTRTYELFLTSLFIIGTGLSILQTAANPYITVLGNIESAAARGSIMGICNKVGGLFAPAVLGSIVLSGADAIVAELEKMDAATKIVRLDEIASRLVVPYSLLAGILFLVALIVHFSSLPEIEINKNSSEQDNETGDKKSIFQFPNLVLGVIALFFYVGAEVVAGDTIGGYGRSLGISFSEARFFTDYTLGSMVIGYIIGIICIPRYISQSKALAVSTILGIITSFFVLFTSGYTSVLCIALFGFSNAVIWPAIWPLAIKGLGKHTETGSALLIMAIAGGAILPPLYGKLADIPSIGHQSAYMILIPCYLFILFYSLKGHKYTKW